MKIFYLNNYFENQHLFIIWNSSARYPNSSNYMCAMTSVLIIQTQCDYNFDCIDNTPKRRKRFKAKTYTPQPGWDFT